MSIRFDACASARGFIRTSLFLGALLGSGVALADTGPASLVLSAPVAFGDQPVRARSAAASILVSNASEAFLSFGAPSVTGDHAADFKIVANTCVTDLAPGSTCAIDMTFTPSVMGARSAALSLPSSAPETPSLVTLDGNGVVATVSTPVLPFDMPTREMLRLSPKKVFAHYFPPYPLSIDNKPSSQDYYAVHYLNPWGEGGIHLLHGGLLRTRPVPQPASTAPNWRQRNMEKEIRRAIAIGIDGFSVDVLTTSGPLWDRVVLLLQTAAKVDPGFKIMLVPDMDTAFLTSPASLKPAMLALSKYPAAFRLDDGRLVVSPFDAQRQSAAWWASWLTQMKNQGVPVAFVPIFQNWTAYAEAYKSISYGFSDWGTGTAVSNYFPNMTDAATAAHQYVSTWMATVRPQSHMTSSFFYAEAGNSTNFRLNWKNAIQGGADWVQIATWNDYGEGTQVAPSTGTQFAFHDLAAFYTAWFKTGVRPPILRDVLYYFHRTHLTAAMPNLLLQTGGLMNLETPFAGMQSFNDVEVLAFLKTPGRVEIETNGVVRSTDVPAGITSVRAPLAEGRPSFRLARDGVNAIAFTSAFRISNRITFQNLMYFGGGSSRPAIPSQ